MTITFEPLPKGESFCSRSRHGEIANQLRTRPLGWAHILTKPSAKGAASAANQIRTARLAAYGPAGSFDAKSRTVNGEHRVYARYLGGAS